MYSIKKVAFMCQECKKIKYIYPSEAKTRKYCSRKCWYKNANIGKNNPMFGRQQTLKAIEKTRQANTGLKRTQETKNILSKRNSGKNNPCYGRTGNKHPMFGKINAQCPTWKGTDVGIIGKHIRIRKLKGSANNYKCVGDGINQCNKQAKDWSNKDHKYSLNPDDYLPRCRSCHEKYDNRLRKKQRRIVVVHIIKNLLNTKASLLVNTKVEIKREI